MSTHSTWRLNNPGLVHSDAFFSTLMALIYIGCLSEQEKGLEILLLPQQVSTLLSNQAQLVRASQVEKLTLAVIIEPPPHCGGTLMGFIHSGELYGTTRSGA
jgi:hypothetical protein